MFLFYILLVYFRSVNKDFGSLNRLDNTKGITFYRRHGDVLSFKLSKGLVNTAC